MQANLLHLLRCPVTREVLSLEVIAEDTKMYDGMMRSYIKEGILRSRDFIFPIIKGVPRLTVEAFADEHDFLVQHAKDFGDYEHKMQTTYKDFVAFVCKKNKRTKASFSHEWNLFDYEKDKVWDLDSEGMLHRFLNENDVAKESLRGKLIFDAGCGNGLLNQSIAALGNVVVGMDFSQSIERAFEKNSELNAIFIQGDVQFPPVQFGLFDMVHCSGVLIHTTNSELSFSCLVPCLKIGGQMSVWVYHPRQNAVHNAFNRIRKYTSKLPIGVQHYVYLCTLFPISYLVKKAKGNPQNSREMMIDIYDWFSPEFRWEHDHEEVHAWFSKRNFSDFKITTHEVFGFNSIGYLQA
jgi:SAM-dependent methyltransferase/uncharacterized protein YbaR (Trm112 family)